MRYLTKLKATLIVSATLGLSGCIIAHDHGHDHGGEHGHEHGVDDAHGSHDSESYVFENAIVGDFVDCEEFDDCEDDHDHEHDEEHGHDHGDDHKH